MTRTAINENVLRWALDRSGLTVDEVSKKFRRIDKWLTGESQPTLRQLEKLARATLTPLGFFFLEKPPEDQIPIPYFRTQGDEGTKKPSPNLLDTIYLMQRRQAWMREYLIEEREERLPFVNTATLEEQPTLIAERIRNTLNLQAGWAASQPTWTDALRVLRETMENTGIIVSVNSIVNNNTRRKLDPNEFRGFVLVDEYAPLVFVNGADVKAAQMFTLAHELAHVFFGSSAAFDLRGMQPAENPTELACNVVAAEFLVPESELKRFWPTCRGEPNRFQVVARRFKVSEIVAARRALDLALIDRDTFFDFYENYDYGERPVTKDQKIDYYLVQRNRIGRRFSTAIITAAKEGKIFYDEAFRLTGLYGRTFDRFAASLGIGGS